MIFSFENILPLYFSGISIFSFIISICLTKCYKKIENKNKNDGKDGQEMDNIDDEKKMKKKRKIEKKKRKELKKKKEENNLGEILINKNEKQNENDIFDFFLNNDIMFGITFLGRIIFTLYSIYGLFFIYNFILQYLTSIPIVFYDLENIWAQAIIGIMYIFLSILISNIIVIPTFDFLCFPFLNLKNPLSHFETFIYFFEDKEQNDKTITDRNVKCINISLIIIELLYIVGFILYLSSASIYNISILLLFNYFKDCF